VEWASQEEVSRVILDPTVLFTEEAVEWLEYPELRPYLVVSEALWRHLEEPASEGILLEYAEGDAGLVERVREGLQRNEIKRFSFEQGLETGELPEGAREICERLLASDEPFADVFADEWAFLTSQSLGVVMQRVRDSLEVLRRYGGEVYEISRESVEAALEAVQDRIPPTLLKVMKHADDKFVKVVLFGGAIAGFIVPGAHIPVAIAKAVQQGTAIVAGDP
jgi:hypothetical protein